MRGDPVQPSGHRILPAHGFRLAGQQQEGRLECVFRVLSLSQHPPAHAEDEVAVPSDQLRKRVLIAVVSEAIQQVAIGRLLGGRLGQTAEVPNEQWNRLAEHEAAPPGA
jgi:hypothetical protein